MQAGVDQHEDVAGNVHEARVHAEVAEQRGHQHRRVVAVAAQPVERLERVVDRVHRVRRRGDGGERVVGIGHVRHAQIRQRVGHRRRERQVAIAERVAFEREREAGRLARQLVHRRIP